MTLLKGVSVLLATVTCVSALVAPTTPTLVDLATAPNNSYFTWNRPTYHFIAPK